MAYAKIYLLGSELRHEFNSYVTVDKQVVTSYVLPFLL